MGGLVLRSACHVGQESSLAWLGRLRALVFLGTPHHGAPLERGGRLVDMLLAVSHYAAPLARLGQARSAGMRWQAAKPPRQSECSACYATQR